MKVVSHRRLGLACSFVFALLLAGSWSRLGFAQTADLDQCRNGSAGLPSDCVANGSTGWVNGNAGASSAHYLESLSIPYRVVMTGLPLGTSITLTLGYDTKHSDKHAIDYLTHYNRLEPHFQFGHLAETVNPTSGVSGVSATVGTFAIPAPSSTSSCASPVLNQPTISFNALPAGERLMTLFGGTISAMAYVSQGCLTDSAAATQISVTFTVDSSTAVLAFGGHIASRGVWGSGNSAANINGSPYHMQLIGWSLGSLGSQDRSLSAGAVLDPCEGIVCTQDVCETRICVSGQCVLDPTNPYKDNATQCRESAGACDVAEYCDGLFGSCPADGKVSQGTVCRESAGVCDVAEVCNGTSNNCPANGFASSSTVCRDSTGVCDVAETCTGNSATCPANQFASSNTVCRPGSGDSCDPDEKCTGTSATCPADQLASTNTICRAGSGDSCDAPEYCTGVAGQACPADRWASADTVCRTGSGDTCDPDEKCTGIAGQACPANVVASSNTVCRAGSGDYCDPDETCTGVAGQACPANVYEPATTMCRPVTGVCDTAEYCPGTPGGWCPGDQIADNRTLCRDASGLCDVAEYCTGYDKTCPTDYIVPTGTTCRPSAGSCDVPEVCDGGKQCPADIFVTAGYLCRESAGLCDPEELCTGNSPLCSVNVVFDPTRDPTCEAEFCRTAGFWSTHAGSEKKNGRSQNITLAVIDLADSIRNLPAKDLINLYGQYGKLEICGENIVNTQLDDAASALESMCVSPEGDQRLQLVRQLTAASLNCILSTGSADCVGVDGPSNITVDDLFAACNTACIGNGTTITDGLNTISCIAALDCWNNGGIFYEATGFCQTGTCSLDGVTACNSKSDCPLYFGQEQSCAALAGTCHDQKLVKDGFFDFDPPGPAGSTEACNLAIANKCTVVAPGEVECKKVDSAP